MMSRKRDVGKAAHMEASRYTSDIFSLVSFTLSPDDSLCKKMKMVTKNTHKVGHKNITFRSEQFYFGSIGLVSMQL